MELLFNEPVYDRLETDSRYDHGLPSDVVALYRKCLQILRAARHEGDLKALRCLRLAATRFRARPGYTIYLNDDFHLLVELNGREQNILVIEVQPRAA